MRDEDLREVRYDLYCKKCKHWGLDGDEEPCWSCLGEPARQWSDKPHKFEEA